MIAMYEQISLFDRVEKPEPKPHLRAVGEKIGRVVLGECRIATITEVEGGPKFPFYRTDSGGCYSYKDGLKDVKELIREAEQVRMKYDTIEPHDLEQRLTVVYPPRECDGAVLWAQIGIFQGMLFWKESMTYQFLERYENDKKLMKEYKEHKEKILSDFGCTAIVVPDEHEMRRLYASKCANGYADAEYVVYNR